MVSGSLLLRSSALFLFPSMFYDFFFHFFRLCDLFLFYKCVEIHYLEKALSPPKRNHRVEYTDVFEILFLLVFLFSLLVFFSYVFLIQRITCQIYLHKVLEPCYITLDLD